jgi:SAM-dependent methyltransferase
MCYRMSTVERLGRQQNGSSPSYTKDMALGAKELALGSAVIATAVDIGAGSGEFTELLIPISKRVIMMDFFPPPKQLEAAEFIQADLNCRWPLQDESVDFGYALEVIEHVENPRQFIREFARILRPGAFGFISTPNNHSWASKLTFLLKDQHRMFQDPSYPAHITPLLQSDIVRILNECSLVARKWFYSNCDTLPRLRWTIRLPGRAFSNCMGILFEKPMKMFPGTESGIIV